MSNKKKPFLIPLLVILALLIAIVQFLPMASIDTEGNIGPVIYDMDADFTFHKVEYNVQVGVSEDGPTGGIGGDVNRKISDEKYFVQGVGGFQGDIGIALNSFPEKDYRLIATPTDRTDKTVIMVSYSVETTPWWVVGRGERFDIEVGLNSTEDPLFSWVEVTHVEIQLWSDYQGRSESGAADTTSYDYTNGPEVLWKNDESRRISTVGGSTKYSTEIELKQDYGQVGLVGVAEVLVHYSDGGVSDEPLPPFPSYSHPNTINIYTIDQRTAVKMVGAFIAGPLSIIGMLLCCLSIVYIRKGKEKGFIRIAGTAGIIEILSSVLYFSGMTTLVGLIEFVGDDFSFSPALALPGIAGGILLSISMIFWIKGKKRAKAIQKEKVMFKVTKSKHPQVNDRETSDEELKNINRSNSKPPKDPKGKRSIRIIKKENQ